METKDTRCCDVFVYGTDEAGNYYCVSESGPDYRYLKPEPRKKYNQPDAERLSRRIVALAAAQDALFVVIDNLEIEDGYRCTACRQTGKHLRQCQPPRGLERC